MGFLSTFFNQSITEPFSNLHVNTLCKNVVGNNNTEVARVAIYKQLSDCINQHGAVSAEL